jgi:hypothetical protein
MYYASKAGDRQLGIAGYVRETGSLHVAADR